MRIRKTYVDTSAGQLHVRLAGDRSRGRPLLLLHQAPSSGEMYEAMMARLGGDFFCIAPDLPGFGASFVPAEHLSVPMLAASMRAVLDCLDLDTVDVFGHHTGAAVAVELAASAPARVHRLALSGPPALTADERASFMALAVPLVLDDDGAHLSRVWQRLMAKAPRAATGLRHREALANLSALRWHEAYVAVFTHDLVERLRVIRCPTLVFAGERDTLRGFLDRAAGALFDATRVVLPDADTYVCDLQPAVVAELLTSFFLTEGGVDPWARLAGAACSEGTAL